VEIAVATMGIRGARFMENLRTEMIGLNFRGILPMESWRSLQG
jgi:hypothetical protein